MTDVAARIAAILPEWRGATALPGDLVPAFRARHRLVDDAWNDGYPKLDRALAAQNPWRGYGYWGPEATRISGNAPPAWFAGFLLWNIERFDSRFDALGLDREFKLHFNDAFNRMLEQLEDPGYPRPNNDVFMKDLGLARGRLIPALGRLLYPYAGLSVTDVLANPGAAPFIYFRCGDRRPFLGLHLHPSMTRAYFNPAGWKECQRLAALALKAFPDMRGVMGASWFYDPAVTRISPHLRYVSEVPLQHGARLLRLGTTPAARRDALETSATRRKASEQGTYTPRVYALLWARADLLAMQAN